MRVQGMDVDTMAENWWAVMLRGVIRVMFGVITFAAPGVSLGALVLLFGAYAFADGAFAIVSAIHLRNVRDHWWMLLLEGLAGVAFGVLTLILPGLTALTLLYVIGAWAFVTGAFEIVAAIRLRKAITGEWLLVLSGLASIGFGVLLFLFPGPGALALMLWIGAYALVSGVLMIGLGFRLRAWGRDHRPPGQHAAPAHA